MFSPSRFRSGSGSGGGDKNRIVTKEGFQIPYREIIKDKMIKYSGRYFGKKVTKRIGLTKNIEDENLWIGFHPLCIIYLADIT